MTTRRRRSANQECWDWDAVRLQCLREAQRVLGPTAIADDAAQEAALRVWLHRGRCRQPERPEPWVSAIARREALRQVADRRAEPAVADGRAQVTAPEPDVLLRLAVEEIAAARLDQSERDLLRARYWADLTHEQIGARFGVPTATVRVRLHRIRRRIAAQLAACTLDR